MFQCLLSDNNLFLNMLQIMLPTPHQHACMRTIAAGIGVVVVVLSSSLSPFLYDRKNLLVRTFFRVLVPVS